jgi:2-polyprenyl-6-methoxyphenol hydroxylase-like FAD-dependent oxidoreductase
LASSRAIIIGAGIGGLAAAIALGRTGTDIDAEVYERSPDLLPVGAGISLWKNALCALERLGVRDDVRAASVVGSNAGLRTWRGDLLVGSAATDLARRFGEFVIVVHRAALQRVLLAAARPERVHLGKSCVRIDAGTSGVTAQFSDGSSVSGDVLIGADGLYSVVRAQLHGDTPPRYSGYTAWRGVVTFDQARLQIGESWGHGQRFGQIPMADGQVYWFATANVPAGATSPDGEKAELRRRFHGWHDPIDALIAATPDAAILRNDIYDRPPLRHWGRGRVTLLGDAAHPMTPNLGQGGCQAIEDAVVLARELDRGMAVDTALRAYEATRMPRTTFIAKASHRVGVVAQIENRALVAARNAFVRAVGGRLQARQLASLIDYVA